MEERKPLNVYQKINEVKKVVNVFSKDAETTGQGSYSYVSGSQILKAIKQKMEEIGLLFLPVETEHRDWKTYNYLNSYGKEKTDFIVDGKIFYEWIDIDNPADRQRVSFEYYGQQNDISKAFGSALTYSERYLLLKSLGAPTDEDDPDKVSAEKNSVETRSNDTKPTPQSKTKWALVNELIKETPITLTAVNEWILKKFGKAIKINSLSDEQFSSLMSALKKKIEDNGNE